MIYHGGDLNDWYWEGEPEEENQELQNRVDRLEALVQQLLEQKSK